MNRGSVLSLNVSLRWGARAKARQIRLIELWLKPVAAAIERVLQWVASRGADSSVSAMTRSTSASPIVRGAPGRGSSSSPSRRPARNRRRHLPTVGSVISSAAAMSLFERPSAAARTMRARTASAWAVVGRRVHSVSLACSSTVNVSSPSGRPLGMASSRFVRPREMPLFYHALLTRHTSATRIPFVKIDEPMAWEAVRIARRVGVLPTVPTTLGPISALLEEEARKSERSVTVRPPLCEGAFGVLMVDEGDRHDSIVIAGAGELARDVELIVLARASMARLAPRLAETTGLPVLSSPRSGVEQLAQVIRELETAAPADA